jgi:alkaline phosphatase/streptomycin-6-phosphatase
MHLKFPLAASVAAILGAATLSSAHDNHPRYHDGDQTDELRRALDGGRAKNVILLIGDGMGDSEITIARNYHVGAAGRLNMDTLPLTGAYTTYAVEETDPSLPNYVTDSAASGTGWATGKKTSNGRISTYAGTTAVNSIKTILERAKAAGFKTGNVSTAELTDATPAVLASHVNDRGCQGPANMANCSVYKKLNGGPGSIAEQLVDHQVDVLLGGGRARFAQLIDGGPHAGKSVVDSAKLQGYSYVSDAAGLGAVKPGQRVLGLFNDSNMSLEWSGALAQPFPGSGPQTCLENQRLKNEPSLAEMTRKAIQLLDRGAAYKNGRGFFLQVEGASIDKQDHAANPCGQIGETVAFDAAIAVALDFARRNPDTLIVVTADHAHTAQIIDPVPSTQINHPGAYSVLTTIDGANMTVNYATEPPGTSQSHTGSQLRIAAQGPQAANVVGITDQTDLYHTLARALGLE